MKHQNKLPISAIIVSCNEGHLLDVCLASLPQNLDERIVIDLESTDNTRNVAKKYGWDCKTIPRQPVVEIVHTEWQHKVKNDWILVMDPDETLSKDSEEIIKKLINNAPDNIAAFDIPWYFHFKGKKLSGTPWGGLNYRILLVHRKRFTFTTEVHRGRQINQGFKKVKIEHNDGLHINHYWMQTYRQLIKKHRRYLEDEGKSRYNNGQRTRFRLLIKQPLKQFRYAYNLKKGRQDGLTGLFLSLFWVWYECTAQYKLWRYQKKRKKNCSTVNNALSWFL